MNIIQKLKKFGCSRLKRYYYNKMELVTKNDHAEDNIKKAHISLVVMEFLECDIPFIEEKLKKVLQLKLELTSSFRQKP